MENHKPPKKKLCSIRFRIKTTSPRKHERNARTNKGMGREKKSFGSQFWAPNACTWFFRGWNRIFERSSAWRAQYTLHQTKLWAKLYPMCVLHNVECRCIPICISRLAEKCWAENVCGSIRLSFRIFLVVSPLIFFFFGQSTNNV